MAFSFSRLTISESDMTTCRQAFTLAETVTGKIEQRGTASCIGEVNSYQLWLGFQRGIPSWQCSCSGNRYPTTDKPCVHMIALSLLWDRDRGVPDPSWEDIEYITGNR